MKKIVLRKTLVCLALFALFSCGKVLAVNAASPLVINAFGKAYKYYPPEITIADGEYKLNGIDDIVDKIHLDTLVKPTDAELNFAPASANNFEISEEKSGCEIDKIALKAEILHALNSGKRTIYAKTQVIKPTVTKTFLKEETILRATFSTNYASSSDARKNNIELACNSLNGAIIDLYGDFSFNNRVGERTEERGYLPAKIISEGKFADGLGGGVCQVSTTLYNAAIRAGLTIKEYHRHSLAVSYVEPSFDAMVSGSFCDLKLYNPTNRRMYVKAFADGSRITVTFFGLKNELEYHFRSEVEEIIPATVKKVPASSGENPVKPKDGLKSSAYVSIYKNDKLVTSYRLRSDRYAPINGIIIE